MANFLGRVSNMAHKLTEEIVFPGDCAVDATCGNGLDTLFLSELVGKKGKVFAIDIDKEAIKNTRNRLEEFSSYKENTILIKGNHKNLLELIPKEYHGKVKVILYNLGYRPGGEKIVTTKTEDTLLAVKEALELITEGGAVIIAAYTHEEGKREIQALNNFLENLRWPFSSFLIKQLNREDPPVLFAITKSEEKKK